MSDTPASKDPVVAPAPTQPEKAGVNLVVDAEDSVPFRLNPAFISLGLPRKVFKKDVGGGDT